MSGLVQIIDGLFKQFPALMVVVVAIAAIVVVAVFNVDIAKKVIGFIAGRHGLDVTYTVRPNPVITASVVAAQSPAAEPAKQ